MNASFYKFRNQYNLCVDKLKKDIVRVHWNLSKFSSCSMREFLHKQQLIKSLKFVNSTWRHRFYFKPELQTFLFPGHSLTHFLRHSAENFLSSECKEVRLEAVRTCSYLLNPLLKVGCCERLIFFSWSVQREFIDNVWFRHLQMWAVSVENGVLAAN